jgi:hypothetical protein
VITFRMLRKLRGGQSDGGDRTIRQKGDGDGIAEGLNLIQASRMIDSDCVLGDA